MLKTIFAALGAAALSLAHAPSAFAAEAPAAILSANGQVRMTDHGGSGPVVVLIPGMSTPGAVWDDTVDRLAATHRLLVVELPGFAGERGTANEAEGVIPGVVEAIAADLKSRGIERAAIAGHSFGGLVAMQFGLDHPDLASHVMVVDALPFFGTVFDNDATVRSIAPRAAQMKAMMIAGADAMRAAGEKGVTSADGGAGAAGMSLDEATRVKIANWALKAEPLAVAQALAEDFALDLRQDIAKLTMPVTVLYQAEANPAASKERYETDYAALKSTVLVPVAKTAHFVMLDRPDVFDAALAALLAR